MLYVEEGIPSKVLKPLSGNKNKEFLLVEIYLRKKKWILIHTVKPVYSGHLLFLKKCPLEAGVRYIEF